MVLPWRKISLHTTVTNATHKIVTHNHNITTANKLDNLSINHIITHNESNEPIEQLICGLLSCKFLRTLES